MSGATAGDVTFKLADPKGQPIGSAVVSLVPLDAGAPLPGTASTNLVEIEQRNQEFSPAVTAIRTGTTVRFPNRDAVEHHMYSTSAARRFEFPLYKPDKAESVTFDKSGVVTIGCNIHDWMLAYVVVLDTPWFAVVPAAGSATLPGVPAGRYRATVWHARLAKPEEREITLTADNLALEFALALKPDRRIRRGPDGAKTGYK